MSSKISYRVNTVTSKAGWTQSKPSGKSPLPLSMFTANSHQKSIYLHGGLNEKNEVINTFSILNTSGLKNWTVDIRTTGNPAVVSIGHSSVKMRYSAAEHLAYFGGTTNDSRYYNHLFFFNPETHKLTKPRCQGQIPVSRCFHAAAYVPNLQPNADCMIIYGGMYLNRPLNDLSLLVVTDNKNEWQTIKSPTASGPSARYNHTLLYIESIQKFLLFGGYDGKEVKNDLWLLTPGTWEWTPVSTSTWCGFKEYSFALLNERLYVFGGKEKTGIIFMDVKDNFKWKRFSGTEDELGPTFGYEEHTKFGGIGCGAGVATVVGDTTIYIIGGKFLGNAIWALETSKLMDIHIADLDISTISSVGSTTATTAATATKSSGSGGIGSSSASNNTVATEKKETEKESTKGESDKVAAPAEKKAEEKS